MLSGAEADMCGRIKVANEHFALNTEAGCFGSRHETAVLAENALVVVFVDPTGVVNGSYVRQEQVVGEAGPVSALLGVLLLAGPAELVEQRALATAGVQTGEHHWVRVVVVAEETELRVQLRVQLFRGRHGATEAYGIKY